MGLFLEYAEATWDHVPMTKLKMNKLGGCLPYWTSTLPPAQVSGHVLFGDDS
jgi:hypothetical protein